MKLNMNSLTVLPALVVILFSTNVLAQRSAPGIEIQIDNWAYIPTLYDGQVETFVALRTDLPEGQNITSMWFIKGTDDSWSTWGWSEQNQSKTVGYVKTALQIPDTDDTKWKVAPIAVNPDDLPPGTMVRGLFADDPFADAVASAVDPDAVLDFLVTIGWTAAKNSVIVSDEPMTHWLNALAMAVNADSVTPTHTNARGDWKGVRVKVSDRYRFHWVRLNGQHAFTLVTDETEETIRFRLCVGGEHAACDLNLLESDPPDLNCSAFKALVNEPLLGNEPVSVIQVVEELLANGDTPPPPTEICPPTWDILGMRYTCSCQNPTYANCFACCQGVYPQPYPGSTLPFRKVKNCWTDCQRDRCVCECDGGSFCELQWSLCELGCNFLVFKIW